MYFIEFLGQMMSLSHLIYPSKGLDSNNNDQSFEPGQLQKPGSMENLKNNFPAISTFKNYIPSLDMIKSMFVEKYNEATWANVHTFLLNSGKSFNTPEFFMALQFIICVYFPGMALGIVYQYYELDQQTQQLIQKQEQEEDIYQVILQEMQQQQPQQSRAYIKQQFQLSEQQSLQEMTTQCSSQSTPMMQFVQFIQRLIEQVIQTPQSMLYQIQYEQDCQSIYNQEIQMQQQQNVNNQYCQYQYYQYPQYQNQQKQGEEMQEVSVCGMEQAMNIQYMIQIRFQGQQFIIVTIKQQVYPSTTTNSTPNNNENGGVNMIIMVIKIKLPGEGHQIVQF